MSDSVREWRFYVDDMISFCNKVLAYTAGMDQSAFVADTLVFDATVRDLELVGEAATHVPDDVRQACLCCGWFEGRLPDSQSGSPNRHLPETRRQAVVVPAFFAAAPRYGIVSMQGRKRGGQPSRNTPNSRNSRAGNGETRRQVMLMGRSPSALSSTTGPQARYGSALRARTNNWNRQPFSALSR